MTTQSIGYWGIAATAWVVGVATSSAGAMAQDRPNWQAPPVTRMVSVRDGASKEIVPWRELLDTLAKYDFVFLGETHTDETTHRVELAVYRQLVQRRDKHVVLAMEMFERDVQGALNDYLAGKISERSFVQRARVWGNYRSGYRPLIEFAKQQGLPVVASNFPRPLLRQIATGGKAAWEQLRKTNPAWVPDRVLPHTPEYWRRVDNAIRGHLASMRLPTDPAKRLWSTQSLWDNSMADACMKAAQRHPGSVVLHINGGFHSAYHDGTVRQLQLRLPEARIATVAVVPALSPLSAEPRGKPVADYVVYAESRARDENDGRFGVTVGQNRPYKLIMPQGATNRKRVPLVIYLVDDGLTEDDGVALLRSRLEERAAVAVVSPTVRERSVDGSPGGRWFDSETFSSDLASAASTVERIWGYLCRHYPVDSGRVAVVGEGTGATVAVAVGLQTDRMSADFWGVLPRRYAQLKDLPVPLKALWGDEPMPQRRLRVWVDEEQSEWWQTELKAYGEQGLGTSLAAVPAEDRNVDRLLSEQLNGWLGQQTVERDGGAAEAPEFLEVGTATPRAMFYGRLQALWHYEETGRWWTVVAQAPTSASGVWRPVVKPELFESPGALPLCPGPFGGTTVVLADRADRVARARWVKLEENDPIAAHSRFHRLRVVTGDEGRTLADVLTKLRTENRRNVLLVPAEFSADPAAMWGWQQAAASFEDTMTLHWLPGLGGRHVEGLCQRHSGSDGRAE